MIGLGVCLLLPVQRLVQRNLFCLGKLLAAAVLSEAQVTTLIGTPLTEATIRTGVFFGRLILAQ